MGAVIQSIGNQWKEVLCIVLGAAAILLSFLGGPLEHLLWVPIVLCGVPILYGAAVGILKAHDITADLLVSIAIIASVLIGEYEAAAEISVIMQVGSYLEEATVSHANNCIERIASLKPNDARLVTENGTVTISADEVVPGQVFRVLPGEIVPADGRVVIGTSVVDTSMITGEPVPKDVAPGDEVSGGTVNMHGAIDILAERAGLDSTVSRMERLIRDADAGKARIVRVADRWTSYIVVVAFTFSVLVFLFTSDIVRSVTVLVVFCPCALVLATPTAIMAASANLSRHGILVRDGGALERLANVKHIVMDKTGTLTTGTMQCRGFVSTSDFTPEKLSYLVASAESLSEHPIGKALAAVSEDIAEPQDFEYIPGMGVTASVGGHVVSVGNRRFIGEKVTMGMAEMDRERMRYESDGFTCVCICVDEIAAGFAILSDTYRPTSHYAVRHFRMLHLNRVMLTGDSEAPARKALEELKMDDAVWECLPSDKLRIISAMDDDGGCCMIGDGVNDAPSLKRASVGISVCGMSNDMAIESSDIVLVNPDLSKLPGVFLMARRTLLTIRAGIAFSLAVNFTATVLAAMGAIGPVGGALIHNIGSVMVITWAALLLKYNPWRSGKHKGASGTAVVPHQGPVTGQ